MTRGSWRFHRGHAISCWLAVLIGLGAVGQLIWLGFANRDYGELSLVASLTGTGYLWWGGVFDDTRHAAWLVSSATWVAVWRLAPLLLLVGVLGLITRRRWAMALLTGLSSAILLLWAVSEVISLATGGNYVGFLAVGYPHSGLYWHLLPLPVVLMLLLRLIGRTPTPSSHGPGAQYFIWADGQEHGPYRLEDLRSFAGSGHLAPLSQVRTADAGWIEARRVPGVFTQALPNH